MKSNRGIIENIFGTVYVESGDEFKVSCHLCGKKSLWVNPDKNVFICFACGSSGNLDKLLPFTKTRDVNDLFAEHIIKQIASDVDAEIRILPPEYKRVLRREQFPDGWDYIEGRWVDPSAVEWGFYNTSSVCFPLREDGHVVYWQSRTILSRVRQKTANPAKSRVGVGRGDVVYRIDKIKEGKPVKIVEGVFDALRVGGVATFGKICTQVQALKILRRRPSVIFICYDPDTWTKPEGYQDDFVPFPIRTAKLFRKLDKLTPVVPIRWKGKKDPADLGQARLNDIILEQVNGATLSELLLGFSSEFD